ncbi:hypothetical protein CBR_g37361 [Chara braunii]|uniref:Uncharacterized protein n=1 Tax=Chara braunii TaxID=69332 RepID=A0A388JZT0_CHABU|nr:hypothetical protein CBR_g37361 [Chara braunii]|eukprot:GBG63275.1 hypothetical protein CBR_g37361 [Chara braunii]
MTIYILTPQGIDHTGDLQMADQDHMDEPRTCAPPCVAPNAEGQEHDLLGLHLIPHGVDPTRDLQMADQDHMDEPHTCAPPCADPTGDLQMTDQQNQPEIPANLCGLTATNSCLRVLNRPLYTPSDFLAIALQLDVDLANLADPPDLQPEHRNYTREGGSTIAVLEIAMRKRQLELRHALPGELLILHPASLPALCMGLAITWLLYTPLTIGRCGTTVSWSMP